MCHWADSTEFGKPHADPYLLALQTQCDSDQAITVEDSAKGAAASLAAEITTILLGSHPDTLEHALLIPMKSLDDVTWYAAGCIELSWVFENWWH